MKITKEQAEFLDHLFATYDQARREELHMMLWTIIGGVMVRDGNLKNFARKIDELEAEVEKLSAIVEQYERADAIIEKGIVKLVRMARFVPNKINAKLVREVLENVSDKLEENWS